MTRSPTANPSAPGPRLSIWPANSAPGENGNSGLYWYLPAMISRSKKLSATASTRTTACPGPATGSGRSPMVRSSGVPARVQSRAFMARSSRFYMGSRRPLRLVQSHRGGGCDNSFFPLQILPFFSLYLQGSIRMRVCERSDEADTEPTCLAAACGNSPAVAGLGAGQAPGQSHRPGDVARPVWGLGRLYGDPRRPEGVFRAGEADLVGRQPAE